MCDCCGIGVCGSGGGTGFGWCLRATLDASEPFLGVLGGLVARWGWICEIRGIRRLPVTVVVGRLGALLLGLLWLWLWWLRVSSVLGVVASSGGEVHGVRWWPIGMVVGCLGVFAVGLAGRWSAVVSLKAQHRRSRPKASGMAEHCGATKPHQGRSSVSAV